jgi:hypothetical protein
MSRLHPKEKLSRVYLDDYPITLMGDEAMPPLSRIVRAGGKLPDRVDVLYLTSPGDRKGHLVAPEEIIDRTAEPRRPIYLRTIPRDDAKPIMTADPVPPPTDPSQPSMASSTRGSMPNVDPVIAQLGQEPPGHHVRGVFRAPSQLPDPPAASTPVTARKKGSRAKRAASLAAAESEAEQRQEDERNHEDTLQDEEEAERDAGEDAETQT